MSSSSLSAALAAALLLAPLAARADGAGVALSEDARLHFFFESELRYDSLAGQGGIGPTNGAVSTSVDPADFILHLRPGLRVAENGTAVSLTGSANIDYVDYTGLLAQTHDLSYLGAAISAALAVGKTGPLGLTVNEDFSRSDHTTNPALGIGSITNSNNLGARVAYRPGGGAIEMGLGYNFGVEAYALHADGVVGCTDPSCTGTDFSAFDSTTHRFTVDARWKFFPKTAIVVDSSIELRNYSNTALTDATGAQINIPSKPFLVEAGLAGLVTEKIRVVIKGGYANTFADSGANFSGPIAQLEAGWDPTPTASLTVGVLRSIQPVSGYGWYDDLRGYVSGKLALGGRVNLIAAGNIDHLGYGDEDRTDTQASVEATIDVEIFRYFHTALGTVLTTHSSNLPDSVFSYNREEVYLRLNFSY